VGRGKGEKKGGKEIDLSTIPTPTYLHNAARKRGRKEAPGWGERGKKKRKKGERANHLNPPFNYLHPAVEEKGESQRFHSGEGGVREGGGEKWFDLSLLQSLSDYYQGKGHTQVRSD